MNKKYRIDGGDIFGLELECREDCGPNDVKTKEFETDDPRKAIELWFRVNKRFPTCTDLIAKTKEDAVKVLEEATPEYLTELIEKYGVHYKTDWFIKQCSENLARGCSGYLSSEGYGDSVYPFCCG